MILASTAQYHFTQDALVMCQSALERNIFHASISIQFLIPFNSGWKWEEFHCSPSLWFATSKGGITLCERPFKKASLMYVRPV